VTKGPGERNSKFRRLDRSIVSELPEHSFAGEVTEDSRNHEQVGDGGKRRRHPFFSELGRDLSKRDDEDIYASDCAARASRAACAQSDLNRTTGANGCRKGKARGRHSWNAAKVARFNHSGTEDRMIPCEFDKKERPESQTTEQVK
jgi:hypothetical protein